MRSGLLLLAGGDGAAEEGRELRVKGGETVLLAEDTAAAGFRYFGERLFFLLEDAEGVAILEAGGDDGDLDLFALLRVGRGAEDDLGVGSDDAGRSNPVAITVIFTLPSIFASTTAPKMMFASS